MGAIVRLRTKLSKMARKRMKLTVAIPSFNGEKHLVECLDSIIYSISKSSEPNLVDIQLFINGSTDGTYQLIRSKYEHLKMIGLNFFVENLGYDQNILRLLNNVDSEYVWLLGDDDVVSANAITEIINVITRLSPACIVLRPIMFEKLVIESDTFLDSLEYYNSDSFFRELLWLGSAISSNIWKNENLQLAGREKFIGTNWIHVPLLMDNALNFISERSPGVIFDQGLVYVRNGNLRWKQNFGNWYATGLNHLSVIKNTIGVQAPELFQLYEIDRLRTNRRDLSLALATSKFSFRFRLAILSSKLFYNRPNYWLIDLPFLLISGRQRKFVTFLYTKIFKK
jgi:glycosyltransferase involved in cell wall biosynthesis